MSELVKTFVFDLQRFAVDANATQCLWSDIDQTTTIHPGTGKTFTPVAGKVYWDAEAASGATDGAVKAILAGTLDNNTKIVGTLTATAVDPADTSKGNYYVLTAIESIKLTKAATLTTVPANMLVYVNNQALTVNVSGGSTNGTFKFTNTSSEDNYVKTAATGVADIVLGTKGATVTVSKADASAAATNGISINGTAVAVNNSGYTYTYTSDDVQSIKLDTLSTSGTAVEVTKTGKATSVLPAKGSNVGLKIGSTNAYNVTSSSGTAYFTVASDASTGFVFAASGDAIGGSAIKNVGKLYHGNTDTEITGVGLGSFIGTADALLKRSGTNYTLSGFAASGDAVTLANDVKLTFTTLASKDTALTFTSAGVLSAITGVDTATDKVKVENASGLDVSIDKKIVNVEGAEFTYTYTNKNNVVLTVKDGAVVTETGAANEVFLDGGTDATVLGTKITDAKLSAVATSYLVVDGTNVLGAVLANNDTVTIDGKSAANFALYTAGTTTAAPKAAFQPEITNPADTVTYGFTTAGGYTVKGFKEGSVLTYGDGKKSLTFTKGGEDATVAISAAGVVTGITGLAAGDLVDVNDTAAITFGTASITGTDAFGVASGKYQVAIDEDSDAKMSLILKKDGETLTGAKAAGNATKVVPAEGSTSLKVTGSGTHKFTTGGNAYFTTNAGALEGFCFIDAGDSLTVPAPPVLTKYYYGSDATELSATVDVKKGAAATSYTLKLNNATAGEELFEITNLGNTGVTVNTNYTFSSQTGSLIFKTDGTATAVTTGGGSVTFATADALPAKTDDLTFKIDDTEVNITAVAAANGITYDSTKKSFTGLDTGTVITDAGPATTIYVNDTTTASDFSYTFGESGSTDAKTFTVTANGRNKAYFTVEGTKVTGFRFGQKNDAIEGNLADFKLYDTQGNTFTSPKVENPELESTEGKVTMVETDKIFAITPKQSDVITFSDGTKLTFKTLTDTNPQVAFSNTGVLDTIYGIAENNDEIIINAAATAGAIKIGATKDKAKEINITGGEYTYFVDETAGAVIKDLKDGANIIKTQDITQASTALGASAAGKFTIMGTAIQVTGEDATDGVLFTYDTKLNGISSVDGTASVTGALNGLKLNGNSEALNITGGASTFTFSGLSVAGLTDGANVVKAGGASNFLTSESGKFTILTTGMSIADDKDGVVFKTDGKALTGIDSLAGAAIGNFAGGLSVNNVAVKVTGDDKVAVIGNDTTVTAINQLGVDDATKAINVSASGVTNFGVDLNGKFDFNGAASFGVAGNGTEVTVFNLGTSAITGVDATETLSGDFSKAFTIDGNALQVVGDTDISVVGGTQILGLTDGASVSKADKFTSAKTDGEGTFTFVGGQSFSITGDKDGVTFLLDGAGKVTGISGVDDTATVSGALNGVAINNGTAFEILNNDKYTFSPNSGVSGVVDTDTVKSANGAKNVWVSGTDFKVEFANGAFSVAGETDGVNFLIKNTNIAIGVESLDAGATISGDFTQLTSVNGVSFAVKDGDNSIKLVGKEGGIGQILGLTAEGTIENAGGASLAITDKAGKFTFGGTSGVSFETAEDNEVTFGLNAKGAVETISGLSGNVTGDFSAITGINGKTFKVTDADGKLTVYGNASEDDLAKIAGVTGGASIGAIGSVSQILTDKAGEFVFTVGGQSFTTADDDTVTFGMSSSKVTSISDLDGSVTGNFSGIKVNGATIDIIGDDEITVVGDGTKLTAIQGVDADATINAAGGVADLVANISASSGKFTFKDSGEFVIAGDSSVTFVLNASASAQVTGIENFGDGVAATVTGGLSQVSVNGNSMSVAGDADNLFSYMVDAAGKATLGGVGGEKVTVSGVGGADFVQVTEQGAYEFFGTAYGLSLVSGESSVLFGTDGKQVTSVADLEGTLKGDFSAAGFTVNGKEFEIAGDSSVGIVGSGSGVTKIVDLSGGANVKGVGGASVAITDSEGKFTFTNGSFSIAGDADGVTFMLEGDKVVGIKDLNEGATLTGSLDQLNTINGTTLDIKDDNNFGVVGATSGISKVVDLSTPANVVNAGGASQAVANTGETFTFPNGTFTISGDSAATFDLDASTSEVTNIKVVSGATVSGPLNGIAINGGASLNVVGDDEFGAVAGDSKLAQLINLSGGANVSEAGGASQFVTDQAGNFTILGTAMEIGGDDNVMFTAGTSGITAIDSLEGTAFGDFSNGIAVNSNDVKVLGDSSIEVTSDGSAVTAIASVTGSDAPTIAAVGGATEIGTDAAGTFTFTTGSASQAFTVGDDDEVTFALDADGVVTGVNALEDGTLGFKDVTDLTVNETELTIESTQNVSLSIADSAVVYVQGVDGEIGGLENATVAATTAMTVNSTDINVQGDEDYKVIVQDGAVVGLTDVSAGATVNVAGVSIAVNESGDFQIGGNDYTFTDENNAFTLTTGDDSQLSGVDELQGNVVIAAPSTQSLAVNGDGIAFASNAEVVTVAAGASGITGVNGLVNKDGVSGDLNGAAIFMGGSSASVSTDGGALTVNEVTYTLLNDDNGITVTGGRVVTDLNENASLFVSEKGKYTVNGNTSDIEVEDTALPIIGLENASDAYIYDPAHILVGKNTPVSEIEQMLGLTTEYPADPNFGTAENPLDTAGLSTALAQDLDKPLEIFATNDTKEPQDMNLAGTDFSKKVHLYDGPQSVEFNNFGANEAIIERENADGTATGGEKNITLGDGGDAVIMKADAGNGSAVDVTGGAGDDSVVVQGSAPVNFDMSQGGDDKIVTFAKSNARMTLEGYDALTNPNAGIHISERWSSLAAAIVSGLLSFGDGLLNINNTSGDSAKIAFAGHTDPIGAVLVNLFDYLGQKLAVAFTNSGGGLADFSAAVEPMLLIGNNDGNKSGGSTLLGGSGDDTAIAGGGDEIDLGLGNNEVVLNPDQNREGAGIGLTRGRTKISGFNGTFNLDHGDVIATDLSSANIRFDGTNVYIEGDGFYGVIAGAKPDGAISYDAALTESADATDPLTTTSGDYTNVLFNNAGVLVKTAIAKEGGVMDVKLDQDQRALNYIGDNSGLTFYDHTGEVLVNLAEGNGAIDTADALFSGINSVAAGAGQTTIIGADDNETLIAGTGNDSIWGAGGNNLMRGNTGTDKTGQTSFFVVAEKDGARNTIEGFNFVTDDNYTNTNKITADKLDIQIQYDQIQTENGSVAISGNDVVLLVNNRSENKAESVIIKDAVGKDFIVSGDGIIDDVIAQVNVDKLTADKFANYFVATGKNATLTVSDEFDKANIYLDSETPLGSDHEGEIPQFYGDIKVIDATGSNAKLELGGNDLDNTILAGTGDASLWGGNGGNDLLVAGLGKNSFFYNYGNGNDTIRGAKEGDVIDLTNILLDDIVDADSAIGDDGVKLQFTDGGSLTVEGTAGEYLIGDDTYVVEDGKWSKKA